MEPISLNASRRPSGCFGAGTLVHTERGLVPIEDIQVGDLVLSEPQQGETLTYKRVIRVSKLEDKAVYRFECYSCRKGDQEPHSLIVAGIPSFLVIGFESKLFPPDYWEELQSFLGWARADLLQPGFLLKLINREAMRVSSLDQIWRTRTAGVGWIELNRESAEGHLIDLRNARIREDYQNFVKADFLDEERFLFRHETEEIAGEWAFTTTVYNLEIEDYNTYFVGDLGILVHCGDYLGDLGVWLHERWAE